TEWMGTGPRPGRDLHQRLTDPPVTRETDHARAVRGCAGISRKVAGASNPLTPHGRDHELLPQDWGHPSEAPHPTPRRERRALLRGAGRRGRVLCGVLADVSPGDPRGHHGSV